jgi:hypothetical protein
VTQSVGVSLTELETPFSDSLIAEGDAAHRQHFFDVAETERKAKVEPDAMTDNHVREAMTMIERDGGVHQRIMPQE